MCSLAAEDTSSWLMIDSWEAVQTYQRTAVVLDHFDHEINTVLGGGTDRRRRTAKCSGDALGWLRPHWNDDRTRGLELPRCKSSLSGVVHFLNCFPSLTISWDDMGVSLSNALGQIWIKQRIVWRAGVTTSI